MATFIVRRLAALAPLLLIVSFLVFSLVTLLPGDPARAIAGGLNAPESTVREVRRELHLDEPLVVQYGRWLGGAVHGDLGESLFDKRSVGGELAHRLPVTLSIVFGSFLVTILLGVPLGFAAGTRPGTWVDRAATTTSSIGIAMPDFWLATILVVVFAVHGTPIPFVRRLPAIGYEGLSESPLEWVRHLLMPWIALGLGGAASLARQIRGALIDTLDQDYIRTARAKGLRRRSVVFKHALKNAAMPAVTVLGIGLAYSVGGTVVMENIFSIPGLGQYALQAMSSRDLPVIQGVVLLTAVTFVLMNLLVDVIYGFLNPKVRLG